MNNEIKTVTHDAAKFWYESRQYFESITLLADTISNQLVKEGYDPVGHSYQLLFTAWEPPETRMRYDRVKNHWFGQFTIDEKPEEKENFVYGFGIVFGFNDPSSSVEPWIPLVYLFKAKLIENEEWTDWEFRNEIFTPINLLSHLNDDDKFTLRLPVENFEKIDSMSALILPLGAVQTTDDVSRIIKPCVESLRNNNEKFLQDIQDFLISKKEDWI